MLCQFSTKAQVGNPEPQVFFIQDNEYFTLHASNSALYPITLLFDFDLKGLKPQVALQDAYVISAKTDSVPLITFIIPEGRSWGYKYAYEYKIGDVNTKSHEQHVYLLPFKDGESYLLSQGYFGQSSHQNEHALDFTMPPGTEVTASREGIVVAYKEDSKRGCPSRACNDEGNYIRILHADGTIADYYHLQQNGALVELGQQVSAGELIGLAGATGWSSGSHLHFIVYQAGLDERITLPTLFKTKEYPNGSLLKEGKHYPSVR